jgi:nicotinamidase-related amidase
MLTLENTALVLIDIQGKLAGLMYRREDLYANSRKIVMGARALEMPIIWNEQVPDKLGPTIPEISELLTDNKPLVKKTFSCCGNVSFLEELRYLNRKQLLIAGIETHVCVYQTSKDLLQAGYEIHLLADTTSSRSESDYRIGVERIKHEGARLASVEMVLFEILKTTEADKFREISRIVK